MKKLLFLVAFGLTIFATHSCSSAEKCPAYNVEPIVEIPVQ